MLICSFFFSRIVWHTSCALVTGVQTCSLPISTVLAINFLAMPADGWPVVIFQHGITGNRTQMIAIAPALAAAGFATVAIDLPLHGLPQIGRASCRGRVCQYV